MEPVIYDLLAKQLKAELNKADTPYSFDIPNSAICATKHHDPPLDDTPYFLVVEVYKDGAHLMNQDVSAVTVEEIGIEFSAKYIIEKVTKALTPSPSD